jgi:hypothetical protein
VSQVEFLRSWSNSPPIRLGWIRGPPDHSVLSSLSKRVRQPDDAKGVALDDQRTEICIIAPNLVQALAKELVALQLRLSPTGRAVVFLRAVVRELLQLLLLPLPS